MTQIGFNFTLPYQTQNSSFSNGSNFGNYSGGQDQALNGLGNPLDALTSALDLINGGGMSSNPWGMDFGNAQPSFNNNSFCQSPNGQNNQNGIMGMMLQMMQMFMMLMMQMFGMGQQNNNSFGSQLNNNNGFTFPGSASASASGSNAFAAAGSNGAYASAGASNAGASYSNNTGSTNNNSNVAPYSPQGSTAFGRSVAQTAQQTANKMGSTGWCYKGVADSLAKHGVNLSGRSAYMAADQLARNDKFQETNVPKGDLKNLPAGAVVVWDKCPGHPHGHISIALGNGKEASDHVQNQIQNYGPRYRVFMPKG